MIVYPDRLVMPYTGAPPRWDAANRHLPADKSISHRLLLFAGLSDHPVTLRGLNTGTAVTLLIDAMRHLGVAIDVATDDGHGRAVVTVHTSFRALPRGDRGTVYLGPSSAAARLLIGVLVGLGIECTVDGDETLRNRPFDWIVDPLRAMGARLDYLEKEGALPIRVHAATFQGGAARTTVGSAQAVSALLFAGISSRRPVVIEYPVPGRDHTQRMAESFGDHIEDRDLRVTFTPGAFRMRSEIQVPRDPSALAYVAALFWLMHRHDDTAEARFGGLCLNPTRLGFFHWMARCGFRLALEPEAQVCGEPVGTVIVRGGGQQVATGLDSKAALHAMIDEVPLAVAIACLLPGHAVFADLYELTFKETDRIAATRDMLRQLGLDVTVEGHHITVTGAQTVRPAPVIPSFGDHRLSMTAHVLLLAHGLGARIDQGECYRTSFAAFGACVDAIFQGGEDAR